MSMLSHGEHITPCVLPPWSSASQQAPKPKAKAETKNQNEAFLLLSCLSQELHYGSWELTGIAMAWTHDPLSAFLPQYKHRLWDQATVPRYGSREW